MSYVYSNPRQLDIDSVPGLHDTDACGKTDFQKRTGKWDRVHPMVRLDEVEASLGSKIKPFVYAPVPVTRILKGAFGSKCPVTFWNLQQTKEDVFK